MFLSIQPRTFILSIRALIQAYLHSPKSILIPPKPLMSLLQMSSTIDQPTIPTNRRILLTTNHLAALTTPYMLITELLLTHRAPQGMLRASPPPTNRATQRVLQADSIPALPTRDVMDQAVVLMAELASLDMLRAVKPFAARAQLPMRATIEKPALQAAIAMRSTIEFTAGDALCAVRNTNDFTAGLAFVDVVDAERLRAELAALGVHQAAVGALAGGVGAGGEFGEAEGFVADVALEGVGRAVVGLAVMALRGVVGADVEAAPLAFVGVREAVWGTAGGAFYEVGTAK
eukprot:TRINITY_DN2216_c0_g1_i2.p2 TRINITY_DN2216_c0_g1~~TRINITY_DN2216_c0_g1_i2.p2  ORF type:complete len:289 (+),score=31.80 TRINITY_DN2216_c0_g1_i2:556-1422(+)